MKHYKTGKQYFQLQMFSHYLFYRLLRVRACLRKYITANDESYIRKITDETQRVKGQIW